MKKGLFVIAALLLMGLVVTNAYAYPVKFETNDYFAWGRTYNPTTGAATNSNPYNGAVNNPGQTLPLGTYTPVDGTEDAFGITKITEISSPDGLTTYWQASAGQEMTAFFYGADDVMLGPDGNTLFSNGFTVEIYLDNTPDFNPNLGTAGRTGLNSYTNVTDGTLVLKLQGHVQYMDYATGGTTMPYTLSENGQPANGTFTGGIDFDVVGGAWMSTYDTNSIDVLNSDTNADFRFTFSTYPNLYVSDWLLADGSAAYGDAVPEPATMSLLGMGLLGLAGLARRKKA